MRFRKAVSLLVLCSFLFSFVFSESLQAALAPAPAGPAPSAAGRELFPSAAGRVSGITDCGSPAAVVIVQDLHCHAEVQRNIARIIGALDARYRLPGAWVEGASGQLDGSWFLAINDPALRERILSSALEDGKITGAEYYAVNSGKPKFLSGMENEQEHRGNLLRLARIMQQQGDIKARLAALRGKLTLLETKYCGPRVRRFDDIVADYRAGGLKPDAFYSRLDRYAADNALDLSAYGNAAAMMEVFRRARFLDRDGISREMQGYLQSLKGRLPYTAYRSLTEAAQRPGGTDGLYQRLSELAAKDGAGFAQEYPRLEAFFAYLQAARKINPLALVREEGRLIEELRLRLGTQESERDVLFLGSFFNYLSAYLEYRISADDYAYFREEFPRFSLLWARYCGGDISAELAAPLALLDEYYQVNIDRNATFVRALQPALRPGAGEPVRLAADASAAAALLERSGSVTVVVAGGFHTEGLSRLLTERRVSNIVITPQVTESAEGADALFAGLLREQRKILASSLQLRLALNMRDDQKAEYLAAEICRGVAAADLPLDESLRKANEALQAQGLRLDRDGESLVLTAAAHPGAVYRYDLRAPGALKPLNIFGRSFRKFRSAGYGTLNASRKAVYWLTHPLAGVPLVETGLLAAAAPLAAGFLQLLALPSAAVAWGTVVLLGTAFSFAHPDVRAGLVHWKNTGFAPRAFAALFDRFGQRFIGGAAFGSLLVFTSWYSGVPLAWGLHLLWNALASSGTSLRFPLFRRLLTLSTADTVRRVLKPTPSLRGSEEGYVARIIAPASVSPVEVTELLLSNEENSMLKALSLIESRADAGAVTPDETAVYAELLINRLIDGSAFGKHYSRPVCQVLEALLPAVDDIRQREVIKVLLDSFDYNTINVSTGRGRLSRLYEFMASYEPLRALLERGAVINDIGIGGPYPVTTAELTAFVHGLNPSSRVIGADILIPHALLTLHRGKRRYSAYFDEQRRFIGAYDGAGVSIRDEYLPYVFPEGVIEEYARSGRCADPSCAITIDPYRAYARRRGFEVAKASYGQGIRADIKLCFNVLYLNAGKEETIIEQMGADLAEGGYIVAGRSEKDGVTSYDLQFSLYQKRDGKIVPVLFCFALANRRYTIDLEGRGFTIGRTEELARTVAATVTATDARSLLRLSANGIAAGDVTSTQLDFPRIVEPERAPDLHAAEESEMRRLLGEAGVTNVAGLLPLYDGAASLRRRIGLVSAEIRRIEKVAQRLGGSLSAAASREILQAYLAHPDRRVSFITIAGKAAEKELHTAGAIPVLENFFSALFGRLFPRYDGAYARSAYRFGLGPWLEELVFGIAPLASASLLHLSFAGMLGFAAAARAVFVALHPRGDRAPALVISGLGLGLCALSLVSPLPLYLLLLVLGAVHTTVNLLHRYDPFQVYQQRSAREEALRRAAVEQKFCNDTRSLVDAFSLLLTQPESAEARELARLYPEVAGYLTPAASDYYEYDKSRRTADTALFEHVVSRALGRKLLGLETADEKVFQDGTALSAKAFAEDAAKLQRIARAGFLPRLRTALLYHDIAKGDPAGFAEESKLVPHLDTSLSNKATAELLKAKRYPFSAKEGLFENMPALNRAGKNDAVLNELCYQLLSMRGYPGQYIRGELNLEIFTPYTQWVRDNYGALAAALTPDDPADLPRLLSDLFYLFNAVDTAAVREGLWDDALRAKFTAFFEDFEEVITPATDGSFPAEWKTLRQRKLASFGQGTDIDNLRAALVARFAALRKFRIDAGEDPVHLADVFARLSDDDVRALAALIDNLKGWYVENATSGLTAESQVKLLVLGAVLARRKGIDVTKPYHVHFGKMAQRLATAGYRYDAYKIRIVENLLRSIPLEDILAERGIEPFDMQGAELEQADRLGAVSLEIDGEKAVQFDFPLSPTADALVKLLSSMEKNKKIDYQILLGKLLDLFRIRYDDYDRVNNELSYLEAMAAAKNDKQKLMEFVKGGTVLEVGPAGGAVLDLLEELKRKNGALQRIIGLDISEQALKDLEARRHKTGASWELVKGNAFELRDVLKGKNIPKLDTIIFCSILHEIYSYPCLTDQTFNKEAVEQMLGEALASLADGGRLIIRDGVIPENGEEWQVMEIKDRESLEFFTRYVTEFKGRKIPYEFLSDKLDKGGTVQVRIQRQDAMEFMYTLTWGPKSFDREVQEQFGVMKRSAYVEFIRAAAAKRGMAVKEVPVEKEWRSYLQPGYVEHLQDKVALYDLDGNPARFPDSNMIIVMEKERELPLEERAAQAGGIVLSNDRFTLAEAQSRAQGAPAWSLRASCNSLDEFETGTLGKLYQWEIFVEKNRLLKELVRNAVEASNGRALAGANAVQVEADGFGKVARVRIRQALSTDLDWGKLEKNFQGFSRAGAGFLSSPERLTDQTLKTNRGMGLLAVGDLLGDEQRTGLVRYLRDPADPRALLTEIYFDASLEAYKPVVTGSVYGMFDWQPLLTALDRLYAELTSSPLKRLFRGKKGHEEFVAVQEAVLSLSSLGIGAPAAAAARLSVAAAEQLLSAVGFAIVHLEEYPDLAAEKLFSEMGMDDYIGVDQVHVLRGPTVEGLNGRKFVTWLRDDQGKLHIYMHEDALRSWKRKDVQYRGYFRNAFAVTYLHELLENAGKTHAEVKEMGISLDTLDELYAQQLPADELHRRLKELFASARRALVGKPEGTEAVFVETALLDESTPKQVLVFSSDRFPLAEAIEKTQRRPEWFFRGTYGSVKEFEDKGKEKLYKRDIFVEDRDVKRAVSEFFRNAFEASNRHALSGGNPVTIEAACFDGVVRLRFLQTTSGDEDWAKIEKNHARFQADPYGLNRLKREEDPTLKTHHGVGLDIAGTLIADRERPAIIRYVRDTESPNALVTEVYLRAHTIDFIPPVLFRPFNSFFGSFDWRPVLEALGAGEQDLRGEIARWLNAPAATGALSVRLADKLLAAAGLRETSLMRFLGEGEIPFFSRLGLLGDLFEGQVHVVTGRPVRGLEETKFFTYARDSFGKLHIYLHAAVLEQWRGREAQRPGYLKAVLAVALYHELLENGGMDHEAVAAAGFSVEAVEQSFARGVSGEEITASLGERYRRELRGRAARGTAALGLLRSLGLDGIDENPAVVLRGTKLFPDSEVRTVELPVRADPQAAPRGLEIVQNETGNGTLFDLVYNSRGELIAVYPAKGSIPGIKDLRYWDLSSYYFQVPSADDPGAQERWQGLYREESVKSRVIDQYQRHFQDRDADFAPVGHLREPDMEPVPYALISLRESDGTWEAKLAAAPKPAAAREGFRSAIIPVYPTVYHPGRHYHYSVDYGYYRALSTAFGLREGDEVLVVGAGSGADSWVVSMKTKNTVYAAGINPLEVANTRETAAVAGFDVETAIGDNIVDAQGKPLFGEKRFDRVVWNMPNYYEGPERPAGKPYPLFYSFWDGDRDGEAFKAFVAGLPLVLKEGGSALIWNSDLNGKMIDAVSGIAEVRRLDGFEHSYVVTPKAAGGAAATGTIAVEEQGSPAAEDGVPVPAMYGGIVRGEAGHMAEVSGLQGNAREGLAAKLAGLTRIIAVRGLYYAGAVANTFLVGTGLYLVFSLLAGGMSMTGAMILLGGLIADSIYLIWRADAMVVFLPRKLLLVPHFNGEDEETLRGNIFHEMAHIAFPNGLRPGRSAISYVATYFTTVRNEELDYRNLYWGRSPEVVRAALRERPVAGLQDYFRTAAMSQLNIVERLFSRFQLEPAWSYTYGELLALAALELCGGDHRKAYLAGARLAKGDSFEEALRAAGWNGATTPAGQKATVQARVTIPPPGSIAGLAATSARETLHPSKTVTTIAEDRVNAYSWLKEHAPELVYRTEYLLLPDTDPLLREQAIRDRASLGINAVGIDFLPAGTEPAEAARLGLVELTADKDGLPGVPKLSLLKGGVPVTMRVWAKAVEARNGSGLMLYVEEPTGIALSDLKLRTAVRAKLAARLISAIATDKPQRGQSLAGRLCAMGLPSRLTGGVLAPDMVTAQGEELLASLAGDAVEPVLVIDGERIDFGMVNENLFAFSFIAGLLDTKAPAAAGADLVMTLTEFTLPLQELIETRIGPAFVTKGIESVMRKVPEVTTEIECINRGVAAAERAELYPNTAVVRLMNPQLGSAKDEKEFRDAMARLKGRRLKLEAGWKVARAEELGAITLTAQRVTAIGCDRLHFDLAAVRNIDAPLLEAWLMPVKKLVASRPELIVSISLPASLQGNEKDVLDRGCRVERYYMLGQSLPAGADNTFSLRVLPSAVTSEAEVKAALKKLSQSNAAGIVFGEETNNAGIAKVRLLELVGEIFRVKRTMTLAERCDQAYKTGLQFFRGRKLPQLSDEAFAMLRGSVEFYDAKNITPQKDPKRLATELAAWKAAVGLPEFDGKELVRVRLKVLRSLEVIRGSMDEETKLTAHAELRAYLAGILDAASEKRLEKMSELFNVGAIAATQCAG